MEPFIGMITMFAGNFAPRGWAFCQGQVLSIAQNTALFSILGTTYGGNGQSTFQLPNLGSRVPVGTGQSPGLEPFVLGQTGGAHNTMLTSSNMPIHTHPATVTANGSIMASTSAGTLQAPIAGSLLAQSNQRDSQYIDSASAGTTVPLGGGAPAPTVTIGQAGGSLPFSNMQPYLGVSFIIALEGYYPSRN